MNNERRTLSLPNREGGNVRDFRSKPGGHQHRPSGPKKPTGHQNKLNSLKGKADIEIYDDLLEETTPLYGRLVDSDKYTITVLIDGETEPSTVFKHAIASYKLIPDEVAANE